jgi:hypothetical protein
MEKENGANSETQVFTIFLGEENTENAKSMMQEEYPMFDGMNLPIEDKGEGQVQ